MRLTDEEQRMLSGVRGPAVQRAMELLVRYGEALGADKLVPTNNVTGTFNASMPSIREHAGSLPGMDAVFAEYNLDTYEATESSAAKVFTCQINQGTDPDHRRLLGIEPHVYDLHVRGEAFASRLDWLEWHQPLSSSRK